jgi:DNA-directed RNA polymerase specialized sigma subunit
MDKKKVKGTTKKKYLTNKELLLEIERCHQKGDMTNEFAKMIMMLCHRYSQRGEYVNYSYNEDMQSFALLTVCKVWRSFDPSKSQNPFAYFTQTIKHAFFQYLNTERKHRDTRDALLVEQGDNPSFTYMESDDNDYNYYDTGYYDNYNGSGSES